MNVTQQVGVPTVKFHKLERLYYHVRHANGCTVDWEPCRTSMLKLAQLEGAQCYEVRRSTGIARRIY